jgi:methyl coenzyme M reductase gamma subunit
MTYPDVRARNVREAQYTNVDECLLPSFAIVEFGVDVGTHSSEDVLYVVEGDIRSVADVLVLDEVFEPFLNLKEQGSHDDRR